MEKRDDIYKNRGLNEYGDVEFADTPEHIRAAWSYFHMPRDYEKYSVEDRKIITNKIVEAWKKKISREGPPEA